MKNIFDLRRFGYVLAYDLNKAYKTYGLSAMIAGLFPLVLFIFYQLFSLIFSQSMGVMPASLKMTALMCSLAIFLISSPSKIYGNITEKRYGSDWLMVPASTFEKFLSMVTVLCVVLPLVFTVLFFGADLLLGAIVPNRYGDPFIANAVKGALQFLADETPGIDPTMACIFLPWLSWCEAILVFALGAVFFKDRKVAKTVLAIICFSIVMGWITAFLIEKTSIFSDLGNWLLAHRDSLTSGKAQFLLNAGANLNYLVVNGLLLFGLYYRIRTLKH